MEPFREIARRDSKRSDEPYLYEVYTDESIQNWIEDERGVNQMDCNEIQKMYPHVPYPQRCIDLLTVPSLKSAEKDLIPKSRIPPEVIAWEGASHSVASAGIQSKKAGIPNPDQSQRSYTSWVPPGGL